MQEKKQNRLVIIISIAIPLAVAALFGIRVEGYDFSFLPPIYASINGLTALLLIAAVIAIKSGKRKTHEMLMKVCLLLSALFLVMYVAYHMTSDPTPYQGGLPALYYFILITHIVLSISVIPLVLFTVMRALNGKFELHRRLARITFPIWLYVAITGVVVYIMISPYYS